MGGEAQPLAAQIILMDTLLDHSQDEVMPLVEWDRSPIREDGAAHGSHGASLSSCFSVFVSFFSLTRSVLPEKNCWTFGRIHHKISYQFSSIRTFCWTLQKGEASWCACEAQTAWISNAFYPTKRMNSFCSTAQISIFQTLLLCVSRKPGWMTPLTTARFNWKAFSHLEQIAKQSQQGNRNLHQWKVVYRLNRVKEYALFRSRSALHQL